MNLLCPRCKQPNSSATRFCLNCGFPLAATCAQQRTVVWNNPAPVPTAADLQLVTQRLQGTLGSQTLIHPHPLHQAGKREHAVLVMDRSGSMTEPYRGGVTKLEAAQRAAITLLCTKERIDPQDQYALVAFNEKADLLVPMHPLSSHKRLLIQTLQALQAGDGTDINEGLLQAQKAFSGNHQVVRRVQLLTDGHGGKPLKTADELKHRGIIIEVTGIGESPHHVDEKLLRQVASTVNNELQYQFIKDLHTLVTRYTQLGQKTIINP